MGTASHRWSRAFGAEGQDYAVGLAVDADGNVYLTGMFTGTANFGGADLTSQDGSADIFLASFTAAGAHRWSKRLGGSGEDSGEYLAVDAAGNVYLTGEFSGTADFGGGAVTSQGLDAFVASFTGAGGYRWSRTLGGPASDSGAGVAIDGSGNVYWVGSFRQSASIGPALLTSQGMSDTFVVSLAPSGAYRWSKTYGGVGEDYGSAIAVDPGGNVSATGRFFESVDFGGGVLTARGQDDVYIVSTTAAGTHRWQRSVGGLGEDAPFDLVADGSGNLYLTGRFQESVDFGSGSVQSNGGSDIFLASYGSDGSPRWSRGIGGTANDAGRRLAVDGAGNVFMAGLYDGTADPGGGAVTSNGGADLLVASYSSTGVPCWQLSLGGTADEAGYGIAVDGSGQVVVGGWFYDSFAMGGSTLTSAGNMDIFVAAFSR